MNTTNRIKDFFGVKYCSLVGSGTTALYLALKAINVNNRKVILPAITCPNVVVAVIAAGGKPVLSDVNLYDCNISIESVRRAMDSQVKAIIAVNSFGYPADIDSLREIAEYYGSSIIEDSCQSYGGETDGLKLGNRGDIGIVSFGYSKPIDIGTGGCVLTNVKNTYDRIRKEETSMRIGLINKIRSTITRKLTFSNKFKGFAIFAKHFGILDYGFPEDMHTKLSAVWDKFASELPIIKENLSILDNTIQSSKIIDSFAYDKSGWLPWRYSFLLPQKQLRQQLIDKISSNDVKYSHLYKPISAYFPKIQTADKLLNSREITTSIVNLRYKHDAEDTNNLANKVRSILTNYNPSSI